MDRKRSERSTDRPTGSSDRRTESRTGPRTSSKTGSRVGSVDRRTTDKGTTDAKDGKTTDKAIRREEKKVSKDKQPFFMRVLGSIHRLGAFASDQFKDAVELFKNPKKREKATIQKKIKTFSIVGILSILLISILFSVGYGIFWFVTYENGQQVFINGEEKAIIWGLDMTAEEIQKTVSSKISKDAGNAIKLVDTITLEPIHTKKKDAITIEALITDLSRNMTYYVSAYEVKVDGESLAVIADEAAANDFFDSLITPFLQEGLNIVESGFVENVTIEPIFVEENKIESIEFLKEKLTATKEAEEVYIVQSGDSLHRIAEVAGMKLEELLLLNPTMSVDDVLHIGDEIVLKVEEPFISVITKERVKYIAVVEKPVETVENPEKPKSFTRVIQQGKNGQEEVEANIVRVNGFEVEKEVILSTIIEEPIPEVIEVGSGKKS